MVWMATNQKEAGAIQELMGLPDRAAGIVAAALLEARLEAALRGVLRDGLTGNGKDATVQNEMFRTSGPLGTFSAKIKLGFMLGLYGDTGRRNLERLKAIRNRFAHELGASSFADPEVRGLCVGLSGFERHFFEYGAQDPETGNPGIAEPDLAEHLKDSRQRFLMCVRLYCAALTMRSVPPDI